MTGEKWKERDFNCALMELWVLNLLKAVPNNTARAAARPLW